VDPGRPQRVGERGGADQFEGGVDPAGNEGVDPAGYVTVVEDDLVYPRYF
jgi:hypothetical protein